MQPESSSVPRGVIRAERSESDAPAFDRSGPSTQLRRSYRLILVVAAGWLATAPGLTQCFRQAYELHRAMEPLRNAFIDCAHHGGWGANYGGRIDRMVRIRNRVLAENKAVVIGRWWVVSDAFGTRVLMDPVFCYNPFHRVKRRQVQDRVRALLGPDP